MRVCFVFLCDKSLESLTNVNKLNGTKQIKNQRRFPTSQILCTHAVAVSDKLTKIYLFHFLSFFGLYFER